MKTTFRWTAAMAVLAGVAATRADAVPVASPAALGDAGPITQVADGCGPYGHRSHFGYCKPNGYGGGYGFGAPPLFRPPPPRCVIRYTYYGPRRFCRGW